MVEIQPSDRALGADVTGIELSGALTSADIDAIKAAWSTHLVLRFRGQNLSDDDLLRFSRLFGPLDKAPINPYGTTWVPENPEINVISNILDEGGRRIGGLGDGEAKWHAPGRRRPATAPPWLAGRAAASACHSVGASDPGGQLHEPHGPHLGLK